MYAKLHRGWALARLPAAGACQFCVLVRPKGANQIASAVCTSHAPDAVCEANRNAPARGGNKVECAVCAFHNPCAVCEANRIALATGECDKQP